VKLVLSCISELGEAYREAVYAVREHLALLGIEEGVHVLADIRRAAPGDAVVLAVNEVPSLSRWDATVLPAQKALDMATTDGARALRMENEIGSIEAGKKADIIVLDGSVPEAIPLTPETAVPNIVYSMRGDAVKHSIIDGKFVMRDRKVLFLALLQLLLYLWAEAAKNISGLAHLGECFQKDLVKFFIIRNSVFQYGCHLVRVFGLYHQVNA
jgi:hypothetical protein